MSLPKTYIKYSLLLALLFTMIYRMEGQNYGNQLQIPLENALERLVEIPPPPDKINCIQEDTLGNIWIGTNSGLYKYDGQQYEHIYSQEDGLLSISIRYLHLDPKGNLWIGNLGYGLQKYNPYSREFVTYDIPIDLKKYPSRPYHVSDKYDKDHLLCAMDRSFGLFSLKEEKFTELIHEGYSGEDIGLGFVRCIESDPLDKNIWWLGTTSGLFRYNSQDTIFQRIEHTDKHLNGLVRTFCFDDQNRLIYGDDLGGVFYLDTDRKQPKRIIDLSDVKGNKRLIPDVIAVFGTDLMIGNRTTETFIIKDYNTKPEVLKRSDAARYVSSILIDQGNRLWLGRRSGFSVYNPKYDIATKYNLEEALDRSSIILDAEQWEKNTPIFVAPAQNDGLFQIDALTGITNILRPKSIGSKKNFLVKGLTFDENQNLWVSSNIGLYKYDIRNGKFSEQQLKVEDEKKLNLGKIQYDKDGIIVIHAFRPQRVIKYNTFTGTYIESEIVGEEDCKMPLIRQFRDFDVGTNGDVWIAGRPYILHYKEDCFTEFKLPDSIGINILGAKCIDLDDDDNLYLGFGTRGMVKVSSKSTEKSISKYGIENGMPSDRTLRIENDKLGATWIASGSGLIYSNDLQSFQKIALPNLGDEDYFNDPRNLKRMHSGDLVLGGNHSIIVLDVDKASINLDRVKPKLQSIRWAEEQPLKLQRIQNDEILIPHQHQSIFINFSDYDFGRPYASTYIYRLVNKSKSWLPLPKAEIAFYDLPYGEYELELTPDLGEFIDNELITKLSFRVLPPWYYQWWAILLWVLIGIALLYGFFKFLLQRQMVAQRLAHVESVKELQNKLFTNITHELRTPLSLIIGSSRNIKEDNIERNKKSIVNNAQVLKNYVDQLLDLSSIDVGKFSLNKVQIDIVRQLKLIINAFDSMAIGKNITIHQLYEEGELMMDSDELSFRKIISNLIHNALKFTASGGHIYVSAKKEGQRFLLSIKDTGGGIKEEHLLHIFDRYYKTFDLEENLGSGIGMALTKELVELLGGQISVESEVGVGTRFSIELPITTIEKKKEVLDSIDNITASSPTKEGISNHHNLEPMLIVEDNIDMNAYIASVFKGQFDIIQKYNGEGGLKAALSHYPKIIISDVMMPKIDGFQLVHQLKDDWRTCDIPVILLTAKADKESRLEGLSEGADAYLAKPFDEDELTVVVKNLIANRKRIIDRKIEEKEVIPSISQLEISVRNIIQESIEDPQLSVDFIAQKMGMSRTTLFRDMKEELGITPSKFIKKVKLHKAIELLNESDFRISEIAFQAGFSDHSYFTRIFKSEMGVSPQDFRNQG